MKTYPDTKGAHDANNEVMLAARRMAEERGLVMVIVVAIQVDGAPNQIVGVECTRNENKQIEASGPLTHEEGVQLRRTNRAIKKYRALGGAPT